MEYIKLTIGISIIFSYFLSVFVVPRLMRKYNKIERYDLTNKIKKYDILFGIILYIIIWIFNSKNIDMSLFFGTVNFILYILIMCVTNKERQASLSRHFLILNWLLYITLPKDSSKRVVYKNAINSELIFISFIALAFQSFIAIHALML